MVTGRKDIGAVSEGADLRDSYFSLSKGRSVLLEID